MNKEFKICLCGGGTVGSMSPLFAITDSLIKHQRLSSKNFYWIGTTNKHERGLVQDKDIAFYSIPSGKLRRYFSLLNFVDPIFVIFGFFLSIIILLKNRPTSLIATGSFVSVPAALAAKLLGIPVIIHQLDIVPSLANKIIAPFADKITITFNQSIKNYGNKAICVGSMVREEIKKAKVLDKSVIKSQMNIQDSMPILLVVGGSSGAIAINELIQKSKNELTKSCYIFHQTGEGKGDKVNSNNYTQYEYISSETLAKLLVVADVVISRAGLGLISELAFMAKSSIIIPIPNSHQEKNAEMLGNNEAAIILHQNELTPDVLTKIIINLLQDSKAREELSINIQKVTTFEADKLISNEIMMYADSHID